ncbi:uroporphyrinogen decarboxylase family protein [Treponema primitia]|nr:uroporphyrinogen decarboxylase family protein [Treponema primitia]
MSPREVIQAAVNFREPDRIPFFISAHGIIRRQRGMVMEQFYQRPPEEQAGFAVDIIRQYGGDIVLAGLSGTLSVKALGGKVKFRAKGSTDVLEPLITDIAELDKINLDRVKDDFHYQRSLEVSRRIVALMGDEYLVSTLFWGPFTLAGLLIGVEQLMRKCLRDKEAVRALLDFCVELIKVCNEETIGLGMGMGGLAEPTASGDMISRKVFEEFALPYLKKVYDWYRAKKLITTLHICGDITNRLDLIPETGTHVLSLDYKVSMKTAAETLGDKLVIAGNADPVGIIMEGDEEMVRKAYLEIFEQVQGVPYALMGGCSIPGATPLANYEVMRDLAYNTVPHYRH